MKTLIERLKYEPGNRELDCEFAFAVGLYDRLLKHGFEHCKVEQGKRRDDYVEVILRNAKGGGICYTEPYPPVTTSIDAVVKIAEQMWPGVGLLLIHETASALVGAFAGNKVDMLPRALCAVILEMLEKEKGE